MLELTRLRVLREVAAQGSFAAAAAALGYTASAVSQQVAALEREVGVALVERGGRVLRLTGAGRGLGGRAEAALDRMEAAERDLARLRDGTPARLRLAAFPAACARLMPAGIAALRAEHRCALRELEP